MSLVSVVLPTFNGAAYIEEALDSIFTQTVLPAEVVVVDDASADATSQVVQRVAGNAPIPVRVFQQRRNSGGPAWPMNVGVEECRTDLVATFDQDDRLCPNKLETVVELFQRFPQCGFAFGQEIQFDSTGAEWPLPDSFYACFPKEPSCLPAETVIDLLLTYGYRMGGASGTAFRKRAWQSVGGFDPRFRICWDYDFAFRLALKGWPFAYSPTVFHRHRMHGQNLTGAGRGMLPFCETQRVLIKMLKQPRLSPRLRQCLQSKLTPELLNLGFWERTLGHPEDAVRAYWLALRWHVGVGVALRGLVRAAAAVVQEQLF